MSPRACAGHLVAACALGLAAACSGESAAPLPSPIITSSTVAAVPHNVLAGRVSAIVQDAESVAVRFGVTGSSLDSVTPATVTPTDTLELPLLGLLPSTAYRLQVVAWAHGESAEGDTLSFSTGALPADLPAFSAGGANPLPGFVAFSVGSYGIVIDNGGRVVWYRALPGGPSLNFQPQPTGHYFTGPTNAPPGELRAWVEFDVLGDVVRSFGCADGLRSRFHDILVEPDGGYWILCDDTRMMDLSAIGGVASAQVTGSVVQHLASDGSVRFRWSAFDHFALTDLDAAFRSGSPVNFTHANAFDFDGAGHVLVSFRSLNEITSIDTATGSVAWRLGGRANQFTFDEAGDPFARQHGLRVDGAGRLVLLDNLGQQDGSRVERFSLGAARTASRTAAVAGSPPVTALLGGAVQQLAQGRVLVAYGNGDRVQEYDAAGSVAWEIHGDPGYVYRATRIASLYHPGRGLIR